MANMRFEWLSIWKCLACEITWDRALDRSVFDFLMLMIYGASLSQRSV